MRLCVHRGTKEIGGTCIEVEAQGKRLVLDVGLPLDAPDGEDVREGLLPAVRNLSTTMGHSTGLIREQCPVW